MNEGQRIAPQWVLKVDGAAIANIDPGQVVEIGRKPLRPLSDDGYERLDIVDSQRSMSKRHALFTVNAQGEAIVRDLNSTNGTYVVRPNGDLMRLPANIDFTLPGTAIRMQFGDIPIDFIREEHEPEPQVPVADLFDYAIAEAKQEPDAADMSVDDILDLRAGEPTALFSAGNVAHRVNALRAAEAQAFPPLREEAHEEEQHSVPLNFAQEKADKDPSPRDLFADAQAHAEEQAEMDQADAELTAALAQADAMSVVAADDGDAQSQDSGESETVEETGNHNDGVIPVAALFGGSVYRQPGQNGPATDAQPVEEPVAEPSAESSEKPSPEEPSEDSSQSASAVADWLVADEPEPVEEQYTPAFEPGSVFERVSKGGFVQPEPVIEVDGFTSDDAKHTSDFTVQFEMARHPQLLPFLAMNPSLYDDLYAWLAAQGNQDVDAALANNEGYQEYRKAVGK